MQRIPFRRRSVCPDPVAAGGENRGDATFVDVVDDSVERFGRGN